MDAKKYFTTSALSEFNSYVSDLVVDIMVDIESIVENDFLKGEDKYEQTKVIDLFKKELVKQLSSSMLDGD